MRFCIEHWARLRAAIHEKGMSQLVASSGAEAVARLRAELEGTADDSTYDPLMSAHNAITARALQQGGLYLMMKKDDGSDYCPLCEARDKGGADPAEWIDSCTDSIRRYCEERGILRGDAP